MKRDYYAVLGVATSATSTEIRRAYQRLARQYSPDVNLWEQDARVLFDEIAEAYRVLSDPLARARYDRLPGRDPDGPVPASTDTPRPGGRRGDDLHVPVEVAFRQAVTGLEADVPVERLSPCAGCGATGTARGAIPTPCGHCDGAGVIWRGRGTLEAGPCPDCAGSGVCVSDPCASCRGRGVAPSRATVHAVLPPGIDTGAQFRIPAEGHSGPFGGPRGDLVIIARVHDDSVFTRKGDNLYCDVPVTIVEAVLGARVPVPTVGGELMLTLPPGTQSGQAFRLRGKGMPRLAAGGRGDLYVTTRVAIPRAVDGRAQELFRELASLLPDTLRARSREGSGR
jgi:molecular chaperone DnaJ